MAPRALELISTLELLPHPEGGYFREVFRSRETVKPRDSRPERAALYEGAPLELLCGDERLLLGPVAPGQAPVHTIPAGV